MSSIWVLWSVLDLNSRFRRRRQRAKSPAAITRGEHLPRCVKPSNQRAQVFFNFSQQCFEVAVVHGFDQVVVEARSQ